MKVEITCIEDVAGYLRSCDMRPPTLTGHVIFRPKRMVDMSAQVIEYLEAHPEHQVTMSNRPFLRASTNNINRLNAQVPEGLRIDLGQAREVNTRYR
jgi:hypothetical protein